MKTTSKPPEQAGKRSLPEAPSCSAASVMLIAHTIMPNSGIPYPAPPASLVLFTISALCHSLPNKLIFFPKYLALLPVPIFLH